MSIDNGMNTWFRATCIRQSGRAPGLRSRENIAALAVKILAWVDKLDMDGKAGLGSPSGAGARLAMSRVFALAIRADHSEVVSGSWGKGPVGEAVGGRGKVGICAWSLDPVSTWI